MHAHEDDIAIIQMVLQGRQQAFATLVARYQGYVFTIVMRHVNNRELAEELAQDVFIKAYKALASFKGTSKFSTWLYTITHNTCLSHLRKKEDETVFPGDDKMNIWAEERGDSRHPDTQLEQKAQQQLVNEAVQQLPVGDGELITLFYKAEQSIEEISIITGLTTSNVKVKLLRARQKLKDILETRYSREVLR
jgi:RNA polymerase sigma factor (sigma-70 family)